jgi:REP element-mobilizing transposase RayT
MPKKPRIAGKGLYHPVYAWGNDRHPVFRSDPHYGTYLRLLEKYSSKYGIDVIAYALMEWHVHLFVHDHHEKISKFMNSLHGEYAQYFNEQTKRVGHVFGERFNNKIVQANEYGLWLTRYIHRQAVEAGITNDPKLYRWTSYHIYIGTQPMGFLKPSVIWEQFGDTRQVFKRYEAFVMGTDDGPTDWNEKSARIVGDRRFVKQLGLNKDDDDRPISVDPKELLKNISNNLACDQSHLVKPANMKERQLRNQAYRILAEEYGLSLRTIGNLFGRSAPSVLKALKKVNG